MKMLLAVLLDLPPNATRKGSREKFMEENTMIISELIHTAKNLSENSLLSVLNLVASKHTKVYNWLKVDRDRLPGIKARAEEFVAKVTGGHAPLALVQKGGVVLLAMCENDNGEDRITVWDVSLYKGIPVPHLSFILEGLDPSSAVCKILVENGEFGAVGGRLAALEKGVWDSIF